MGNVLSVAISEAGYEDAKQTVSDIHFSIQPGEIVGLIGPNGAGKSTTIKALLGMLPELSGEITFPSASPRYAYVPEHPVVYDELTLWEHLELAQAVCQLERDPFEQSATSLLRNFQMTDVQHHLPGTFSKGMQQKLMLILAFLLRPPVYIVDEPFIGLDPQAALTFQHYLTQETKRGAGVLMATHVLDSAEKLCHRFILVNGGKIAAQGSLTDIRHTCQLQEGSLLECFQRIVTQTT